MKTKISIALLVIVLISGCSISTPLEVKPQELPDKLLPSKCNSSISAVWWKAYNDPVLNDLIEEALKGNDDYKVAISKLWEAEALLGLKNAERYPTLNLGTSINRQKTSSEINQDKGNTLSTTYQVSLGTGYEIDLWGKLKNLEYAAYSEYQATLADRDTVRISLIAAVAEAYVNLISINRQILVLEEKVKLYESELAYNEYQHRFGAVDAMTLEQSHGQVADVKLSLEQLKESKSLSENALALLVGRSPKSMQENGFLIGNQLPISLEIPSGIPSEILQQRPDIRSAEEHLRAAHANVDAAKAAYFPSISLTGNIGSESTNLGKSFQNSANFLNIGSFISMPIFDFGRIDNQIENLKAQKNTSELMYAKTVRNAFKEVFDSLKKIEILQKKLILQEEALSANRKVESLSTIRYNEGYVDYLNVIDAKNRLLSAEQNTIDLQMQMIIHQITLYKVFGGGWNNLQR